MQSLPMSIISKPSKKTVKSANPSVLAITSGSYIALFNRINSQTVRTKFLSCANSQFHTSSTWSPIIIRSLDQDSVIRFGSRVVLEATDGSGLKSAPLRLRRVEKNIVDRENSSHIGQLHKVVFENASMEVTNEFWSADVDPRASSPKSNDSDPALSTEDQNTFPVEFRLIEKNQGVALDHISDSHCWTMVGVDSFTHDVQLW